MDRRRAGGAEVERKGFTVRIARWSAEHPWRAMGFWVLFVAASIFVGNVIGTHKAENSGNVGETARAQQMIKDGNFPKEPSSERILITSPSGPLDVATAQSVASDAAGRFRTLKDVASVGDPLVSADRTMVMLPVKMAGDPDTTENRVQPLLDTTAAVQHDHPALRVEEVGDGSISKALNATIGKDFQRAEMFSLPLTLLILLVAFGALIAAGVPVLLALSAVGAAIGLSSLASHLIPAQDAVNSVILLIGMAVGIDYSLFYLRREREERATGAGHIDAVEIAAATSGHAVVVSGIAVTIAMAGMFMANDIVFSSIAVGTILVVLAAMIGSITVLPALLAKLGRWVDRPRIPLLWRLNRRIGQGGISRRLLGPVLRHPVVALLLGGAVVAALAIPALGMKTHAGNLDTLPGDIA